MAHWPANCLVYARPYNEDLVMLPKRSEPLCALAQWLVVNSRLPRHAVRCEGLNLLTQVGPRPDNSALAQAYRVVCREIGTLCIGVGSGRIRNTTYTAGQFSYTTNLSRCVEKD